jgi:hypothetical protein
MAKTASKDFTFTGNDGNEYALKPLMECLTGKQLRQLLASDDIEQAATKMASVVIELASDEPTLAAFDELGFNEAIEVLTAWQQHGELPN